MSSETEEVCSDTETIDVSLDGLDANSLAGSKTDKIANLNNRDYEESEEEAEDHDIKDDYDTLMFKAQYIYIYLDSKILTILKLWYILYFLG